MNIRSVMLVSALCVLGWSIWGLINLPDWVLAQRLPNRELPVKLAEGYAVLRHLWPVLAFGILLGGGLLAEAVGIAKDRCFQWNGCWPCWWGKSHQQVLHALS